MKFLIALCVLFAPTFAHADLSIANLAGTFTSGCIQTQMNGRSGFAVEAYTFTADSQFTFTRSWFVDSACSASQDLVESQSGPVVLGNVNTNNGFNPSGTTEAAFNNAGTIDKGLVWVSGDGSKLRVARGMGSMQNTMLGLFQYSRSR